MCALALRHTFDTSSCTPGAPSPRPFVLQLFLNTWITDGVRHTLSRVLAMQKLHGRNTSPRHTQNGTKRNTSECATDGSQMQRMTGRVEEDDTGHTKHPCSLHGYCKKKTQVCSLDTIQDPHQLPAFTPFFPATKHGDTFTHFHT